MALRNVIIAPVYILDWVMAARIKSASRGKQAESRVRERALFACSKYAV